MRLQWSATGQRLGGGGLALGQLFGPHPVRDLVQPQVHGQRGQKHVEEQTRIHADQHEPAQWRRGPTGEDATDTPVSATVRPDLRSGLQQVQLAAVFDQWGRMATPTEETGSVHHHLLLRRIFDVISSSLSFRPFTGRCPHTVVVTASPAPAR